MRPWILQSLAVLFGSVAASQTVRADEVAPVPKGTPAPVVVAGDPYRAATPYNATTVGRSVPNPALNRTNFTIPCDNPNQNFAPLEQPPCCLHKILKRTDDGCSNDKGCRKPTQNKHNCQFGVGACATCNNSTNFALGSSRSFFGESSRDFFEKPPAVDGIRHKWYPQPVLYRNLEK